MTAPKSTLVQIGWEYALVRRSTGKVNGKIWSIPIWLRLVLNRDEQLGRRFYLGKRPIYVGDWEPEI